MASPDRRSAHLVRTPAWRSQQQWISRNCDWKSWTGANWNMVFHASVQTTEHYLGCKQKLRHAVNDNLGLEDI